LRIDVDGSSALGDKQTTFRRKIANGNILELPRRNRLTPRRRLPVLLTDVS
jgi:hypothetical protein